jgi:hypothetical protein
MWKDVPGWRGQYQVSEEGQIRNWSTWKVLKRRVCKKDGALMVNLSNGVGMQKTVIVARIVAEVFVPNPEGYKFVKYKDDNKLNVHADNLYWSRTRQKLKERVEV